VVVEVTEAQIAAARLDVGLAAAEAYYDLLAAREALTVGVFQERVRGESLTVVQARYDLGDATRLELLRAEASLAEVTPTIAGWAVRWRPPRAGCAGCSASPRTCRSPSPAPRRPRCRRPTPAPTSPGPSPPESSPACRRSPGRRSRRRSPLWRPPAWPGGRSSPTSTCSGGRWHCASG
jgi:hypothetical protein